MNSYMVALNAILASLIQLQQASTRISLRQTAGEKLTAEDLQAIRGRSDEAMADLDAAIAEAIADGR